MWYFFAQQPLLTCELLQTRDAKLRIGSRRWPALSRVYLQFPSRDSYLFSTGFFLHTCQPACTLLLPLYASQRSMPPSFAPLSVAWRFQAFISIGAALALARFDARSLQRWRRADEHVFRLRCFDRVNVNEHVRGDVSTQSSTKDRGGSTIAFNWKLSKRRSKGFDAEISSRGPEDRKQDRTVDQPRILLLCRTMANKNRSKR